MVFSDFGHDDPFRRYSRSKSEVVENRPKFCMFLAPHFLGWGNAPEFSDLIYLFPQVSDHVAKFHGDRSRDGGEKLAKEIKKNITSKIEDLPFYRTGGLINRFHLKMQLLAATRQDSGEFVFQ